MRSRDNYNLLHEDPIIQYSSAEQIKAQYTNLIGVINLTLICVSSYSYKVMSIDII